MVIPLAILCALALAAVGASLFAFVYAKTLVQAANQRTNDLQSQMESALQAAQTGLEELTAQVRDLEHQPVGTVAPAMPRLGFNLTVRSQVLRMHRRGEPAEQIAKVLEVPLQEVELLLKVHRIVLSSMEIHGRRAPYPPGPAPPEPQTAI